MKLYAKRNVFFQTYFIDYCWCRFELVVSLTDDISLAAVTCYSWNVTNHLRPTISGPKLPYQVQTYNIIPPHKAAILVLFNAFFSP